VACKRHTPKSSYWKGLFELYWLSMIPPPIIPPFHFLVNQQFFWLKFRTHKRIILISTLIMSCAIYLSSWFFTSLSIKATVSLFDELRQCSMKCDACESAMWIYISSYCIVKVYQLLLDLNVGMSYWQCDADIQWKTPKTWHLYQQRRKRATSSIWFKWRLNKRCIFYFLVFFWLF